MVTASPSNTNFAELLWQAADAAPGRVAIQDEGAACNLAELRDRAAAMATALRNAGVGPGDPVCILTPRGVEAAAAFFGSAACGAITCLVNELYRPRQLRHVLAHSGTRVLVASNESWAPFADAPPPGVLRLDPALVPLTGSARPVERSASDPAQLIYTSGSTGQPKGVLSSHANLWAGARVVPAYLGITSEDRIASLLPFSFVYGFSQLACALVTGATLVIERATLPQDIVEGLRAARVTVLAGVPPLWMQLLPVLEKAPLQHLRVATCAGGRLAPELVRRLRACQPGTRLFLMYGLTEVFRSTSLPPEEVDEHPDSMGRAVPGSEVMVLRDDGAPCADGEVGELVHRGPTVSLGYWRDAEATARVFRPNPLRRPDASDTERVVYSGDLVRRDRDGRLYYVGRRDLMIKTLGYRVSPEEIVDALMASGLVREAAVSSEPDDRRGEHIVAHVCLVPGATVLALKKFCGVELPRYMQPARFEVYDSLPRNPSGKIDLVALAGKGA